MLTQARKDVLDRILDEIVPGDAERGIPGAGALGLTEFILSATRFADDPVRVVDTIVDHVPVSAAEFGSLDGPARVAALEAAERAEPEAFSTLVRLVYMGYYSRADIRPLVGVGARPVHPDGYRVAPEPQALLEALTAPVLGRGPFFRPGLAGSREVGEGGE